MNFNTAKSFVNGSGRNQLPLQTLASTTETAFLVNTDSGTGVTAFLTVPSSAAAIAGSENPVSVEANAALLNQNASFALSRGVARPEFNSGSFGGRPFRVKVIGTGTAVAFASNTLIINLRQGTSTTVASNNLVATGPTWNTAAGGSFNFYIEATFLWDSVSTLLSGFYKSNLGFGAGTYTAEAKTTVATVTVPSTISFTATTTWGTTSGGTVQINEFSLERV
jgi:hypothetical protein